MNTPQIFCGYFAEGDNFLRQEAEIFKKRGLFLEAIISMLDLFPLGVSIPH